MEGISEILIIRPGSHASLLVVVPAVVSMGPSPTDLTTSLRFVSWSRVTLLFLLWGLLPLSNSVVTSIYDSTVQLFC